MPFDPLAAGSAAVTTATPPGDRNPGEARLVARP